MSHRVMHTIYIGHSFLSIFVKDNVEDLICVKIAPHDHLC